MGFAPPAGPDWRRNLAQRWGNHFDLLRSAHKNCFYRQAVLDAVVEIHDSTAARTSAALVQQGNVEIGTILPKLKVTLAVGVYFAVENMLTNANRLGVNGGKSPARIDEDWCHPST